MDEVSETADRDHNGMRINADKFATMLLSASRKSKTPAMVTANGQEILNIKLSPYDYSECLPRALWMGPPHGQYIVISKANSRKFFLMILRRCGVDLHELVRWCYTFVRPLLEYDVQEWHPGPTKYQTELIERLQKQTLRMQPPANSNYRKVFSTTDLQTLKQQKVELLLSVCGQSPREPLLFRLVAA